jgi:ABC-type phosphate/phosphonate transport system substrate-binding protein
LLCSVQVADEEACITALQNREVDYWIMVPFYLYDAIPLGAQVIGFEEYPTGAAAYYAVAIVRKEDCDRNPALTIADYRGRKAFLLVPSKFWVIF